MRLKKALKKRKEEKKKEYPLKDRSILRFRHETGMKQEVSS
jgi:hypothetical protein